MGRIVASVKIANSLDPIKSIICDALVDTAASHMTLPSAWKSRLGDLRSLGEIKLELANQQAIRGEVCGPVLAKIEGFRPVFTEVLFVDMEPHEERYEPLTGYLVLEASQAAVDMFGHRLVKVKHLDLKRSEGT